MIACETLDWVLPRAEDPPETVGTSTEDLINLIGLDDTDPEFVEVFLEEARGELTAIREHLALWRSDLTDHQALTAIRRAFHTLKGSGRMVNAMVIGDFAWEFESLLNQVLEGSLPAHREIVDVAAAAVEALSPLVGAAPLRGDELETLAALAAQARALPQTACWPHRTTRSTPERGEPAKSSNQNPGRRAPSGSLRQTWMRNSSRSFSKKRMANWRLFANSWRSGGRISRIVRR